VKPATHGELIAVAVVLHLLNDIAVSDPSLYARGRAAITTWAAQEIQRLNEAATAPPSNPAQPET